MNKKSILAVAAFALLSSSVAFAADNAKTVQPTVQVQPQAVKPDAKKNYSNLGARTKALEVQLQNLQEQIASLKGTAKESSAVGIGSIAELYAHGPAVVTSPALGIRRSADDASDLVVNLSSMNEDLQILKVRQKMDNYANKNNIAIPERPIIALSGGVEGQGIYLGDYSSKKDVSAKNQAQVDLTRAELDVVAEASPWATAAMLISYENTPPSNGPQVDNSRFKLDRGFLTFGQLNKFPVYFTLGQTYASFGAYSYYSVTDPLTKQLGRIKTRLAALGYSQGGVYAQVYTFPGETEVAGKTESWKRGGANLGYNFASGDFSMDIGAGITGNLAESQGMQATVFKANENNAIFSRVSAVDGHAKFRYAPVTILGEYLGATKRFDARDVAFNGVGAKPQALDLEAAYNFTVKNTPNTFAVGYGRTWEALSLSLPKHSVFAEYNVSLIKNTVESIEYRHDINYNWSDVGTGGNTDPISVDVKGRHRNVVTAQIGVYF